MCTALRSAVTMFFLLIVLVLLLGCNNPAPTATPNLQATIEAVVQQKLEEIQPTATLAPSPTPIRTPRPTSTPTPVPTVTPTLTIPEIVAQVRPTVVRIRAGNIRGSGTIMTSNGCILTSDHVVEDHTQVTVSVQAGPTELTMAGNVIGVDEALKVAVIKISGSDWPYLEMVEYIPQAGESTIIIGHSFDFPGSPTVTKGIVSETRAGESITWIQTDALLSPGDSGGAGINADGKFFAMPDHTFKGEETDNTGFMVALFSVADDINRLLAECSAQKATPP